MRMAVGVIALVGTLAVAAYTARGDGPIESLNNFPLQKTPLIGVFIQPENTNPAGPATSESVGHARAVVVKQR